MSIDLDIFTDGNKIVFNYQPVYDIIFMDIEMPGMDGMTAARQIRTKKQVIKVHDTMKNMESKLKEYYFEGCNVSYLVNLAFVSSIAGDTLLKKADRKSLSCRKAEDPLLFHCCRKLFFTFQIYKIILKTFKNQSKN